LIALYCGGMICQDGVVKIAKNRWAACQPLCREEPKEYRENIGDAESSEIGVTASGTRHKPQSGFGGYGVASKTTRYSCYHGISLDDEHEWDPDLFIAPKRLSAGSNSLSG